MAASQSRSKDKKKLEQHLEVVHRCILVKQNRKKSQFKEHATVVEVPECVSDIIHVP